MKETLNTSNKHILKLQLGAAMHNVSAAASALKRKVVGETEFSPDTIIDLSKHRMNMYQEGAEPKAEATLFNEFIENNPNTVRKKKDFVNTSDRYLGDKKIRLDRIRKFYGVENNQFKVGDLKDFSDETSIVPVRNRFGLVDSVAYNKPNPDSQRIIKEFNDSKDSHDQEILATLRKHQKLINSNDANNSVFDYKNFVKYRYNTENLYKKNPNIKIGDTQLAQQAKRVSELQNTEGVTYYSNKRAIPKQFIERSTPKMIYTAPNTGKSFFVSQKGTPDEKYANKLMEIIRQNGPIAPILLDNGRYSKWLPNQSENPNPIESYTENDFVRKNKAIFYIEGNNQIASHKQGGQLNKFDLSNILSIWKYKD